MTDLIRRVLPQGARLGESKALDLGGTKAIGARREGRRGN